MNNVFASWKKPARFERNLVVIGAGSAGLITAYVASSFKAKVTLVEKRKMGGAIAPTPAACPRRR